MANDSLFNTPPASEDLGLPGAQPEPEVSPDNGAPAVPASGGVSLLEVQGMLEPLQTQLTESRGREADLEATVARLQAGPGPTPQSADEFIDGFTNDAKGTVEGVAERVSREHMGKLMPFVEQTNESTHQMLTSAQKTIVDGEYGAGTWEAIVEPVYVGRMAELKKSNPMGIANAEVLQHEVNGILGLNVKSLMARMTSAETEATTAQTAADQAFMTRMNLTGMTGGSAAPVPSTSRETTDAEKAYLASKAVHGESADIQSLRQSAGRGGSLAEYQAAQAAPKETT